MQKVKSQSDFHLHGKNRYLIINQQAVKKPKFQYYGFLNNSVDNLNVEKLNNKETRKFDYTEPFAKSKHLLYKSSKTENNTQFGNNKQTSNSNRTVRLVFYSFYRFYAFVIKEF